MAKKAQGKHAKAQPQRLHFGAVPQQVKSNRTSTAKGRNEPTYNLLTCLACAQKRNIDIIGISPLEAQGELGRGGQAVVGQTRASVDAVLAFKRPNSEGIGTVLSTTSTRRRVENVYRDVATEMLALSEPGIQGHAHIIQLQAICWEVHKIRTWFFGRKLRVWPILVMEKAELGDLQCYMATKQGQQLSTSDKMSLCQGLASAVATAHRKGIIHGDIKPQNVLMFSENGKPVAKLSDFGFSVFASTKSLKLGGTTPWKAPEIEARQEHTLLQAKRTDLFSFGMLCLWVLFWGQLSERGKLLPPPPPSSLLKTVSQKIISVVKSVVKSVIGGEQAPDPDRDFGPDLRYLMAINTLDPSSNALRDVALDLVDQMGEEERPWKEKLRLLFDKTLVFDEKSRGFCYDFSQIEEMLKEESTPTQRPTGQADNGAHLSSLECLDPSSFEVSELLQSLCLADFRVRAHIFECLYHAYKANRKSKGGSNLAFQLAFCHKVGFGTTPDDKKANKYLLDADKRLKKTSPSSSIPVNALEAAIRRSKEVRPLKSTLLHKMCQTGIIQPTHHGVDSQPRHPEEQQKIIGYRRKEVHAMEERIGKTHPAILNLKWSLTVLLMESLDATGPIEFLHDMVKSLEQTEPEPQEREQRHRDIAITKGYRFLSLMRIMGPQSAAQLVTLAEKTDKELASLRDPDGQEHVVRLLVCIALSDLLGTWGRLIESKVYLERAQSGMKAVFGENHGNTIMLMEKDAQRQIREGDTDKAIETLETVIKRMEKQVGPDAMQLVVLRTQLTGQLMIRGELVKADEVEKGTREILRKRMPELPPPVLLASITMSMALKNYGEAASIAKRVLSGPRLPWPPSEDEKTPKETDAVVELLGKDCFSKPYPDPNIFPRDPVILGAQGALIMALQAQAQAQEEEGNSGNAKGLRGEANRYLEELLRDIDGGLGKGNWETLSKLEGIDVSALRRAMDDERIPLVEMVTSLGCGGVRDGMHYKEAISVARSRGFSKVTALLEEHQSLCTKEAPPLNARPKFRNAAELADWVSGHWMGAILYNKESPRKDPKGHIDIALQATVCGEGDERHHDKADVKISGTYNYDMGDLLLSGEATLSGSINFRGFYKGVSESEALHYRGHVDLDRHAMGGFYGLSNVSRETSMGTFFFYKDRSSDSSGN